MPGRVSRRLPTLALLSAVHLDVGDLLLIRVIADLRDMDNRAIGIPGDDARGYLPPDCVARGARRNQGADDEPSVVVLQAPVKELQSALKTMLGQGTISWGTRS
jgi:hypothetical protein